MNLHIDILITQIINFLIIFFIFKKFLWDKIVTWIKNREELIEKLRNANVEYDNIIENANKQKKEIIDEWLEMKNKLIMEWKQLWQIEKNKLINEWKLNYNDIIEQAKLESTKIKQELEENWTNWVKQTSKILVKKLIETNPDIYDKYIDILINELKSK